MAIAKVIRGQQITRASLDTLATEARAKLGKPYVFLPAVVLQVDDQAGMLKCDLAYWGEASGGIVVVRDERKVYRFVLTHAENFTGGRKVWEIPENWVEQTDWHVVDHHLTGDTLPFNKNLITLTTAIIGHFAAVISPFERGSGSGLPADNGYAWPVVYQLYRGVPTNLSDWRTMGGGQESAAVNRTSPTYSEPIWSNEMRTIQTDAVARLIAPDGRPYKSPPFGQRRIPAWSIDSLSSQDSLYVEIGVPIVPEERFTRPVVSVNFLGGEIPTWPASNRHYVRAFKEIDYYCRQQVGSPNQVYVFAQCKADDPGAPSMNLNFKTILPGDVNILEKKIYGVVWVTSRMQPPTWHDNTGIGIPRNFGQFEGLYFGNYDVLGGELISPADFAGGQLAVSAEGPSVQQQISYSLTWRIKCEINGATALKIGSTPLRRGRLPDIAIEKTGFNTPLGNVAEIGRCACVPIGPDRLGVFTSKHIATVPLFPLVTPFPPTAPSHVPPFSGLKGEWGSGGWTIVPYPCYPWPPSASHARWSIGENILGQAALYDVYALRTSTARRLTYPASSTQVRIGKNNGGAFEPIITVAIPSGAAGARATETELAPLILTDNEPLYFQGSGVSMVQIMAIKRRSWDRGDNIKFLPFTNIPTLDRWDWFGAQFGFTDTYNEIADQLADLP